MAQRKRTEAQIAIDLVEIETLSLRGNNAREIAEILSKSRGYTLSRQQIQYDIDKLDEIWQAESIAEIDKSKRRILAEIRDLQREYWEAWHRSQQNAEKEIKKAKGTAKGGAANQEIQKISEGQTGDPRFLTGVQWCIERRCLILGVDAPKKTEHTGKDGKDLIPSTDNEKVLERVNQLLELARQRKEKDAA